MKIPTSLEIYNLNKIITDINGSKNICSSEKDYGYWIEDADNKIIYQIILDPNKFNTGLKVIDSTYSYKLSADTFINFVVTAKNTTDSPIDISEIALIFRPNSGNYINYPYNYMIARNVFDTITMEPGEVRSFTMTISV